RRLLEEEGIEISPGFGPLEGKVWRIGTMGANASQAAVDRVTGAIAAAL
ncbi:MAG: alanine--glyoxylate aminotransferase family protein, partial [Actinomycetota bacterium]|nr:alanine--glyoxylate aminotransferase family protein [Actinomycetota bacterium]